MVSAGVAAVVFATIAAACVLLWWRNSVCFPMPQYTTVVPTAPKAAPGLRHDDVVVCTWSDATIKEFADITASINQRYCARFGYKFVRSHERRLPGRHPSWEKLPLALQLLQSHSTVIWVDADACLLQDNHATLDSVLTQTTRDVVLSGDAYSRTPRGCGQATGHRPFNMGVFIIRKSPFSLQLLGDWIDCTSHRTKKLWEQSAFERELWKPRHEQLRGKIDVVRYGILQHGTKGESGHYSDSAVLHLAGESRRNRVKVFSGVLASL